MARTALTTHAVHGSNANAVTEIAGDLPQFNSSDGRSLVVTGRETIYLFNPAAGAAVHVSVPSSDDAQHRKADTLIDRLRIAGGAGVPLPKFRAQGWTQGTEGIHLDADETIHSEGTLTLAGQVTANDTVSTNVTYTFVATPTVAGDVAIGATVTATLANLAAAINGTDGLNDADPDVAAIAPAALATTLVLEALVGGTGGDSIPTTSSLTNVGSDFDDVTLGTTQAGAAGSARLRYLVLKDPVD